MLAGRPEHAAPRGRAPSGGMAQQQPNNDGDVNRSQPCPPFAHVFDGFKNKEGEAFIDDFVHYADHYRCSSNERVNLLSMSLSGIAKDWYRTFLKRTENYDGEEDRWTALRAQFIARFHPSTEDALLGERTLANRPQLPGEPATAYIDTMQLASRYCPEVTENQLVRLTISGLRPEVRSLVTMQEPKTLAELYMAASKCSCSDLYLPQTMPMVTPNSITPVNVGSTDNVAESVTVTSGRPMQPGPSALQSMQQILFPKCVGPLPTRTVMPIVAAVEQHPAKGFSYAVVDGLTSAMERLTTALNTEANRGRSASRSGAAQFHRSPSGGSTGRPPSPYREHGCKTCGDRRCPGRPGCRAQGLNCNYCGKLNHLERVCEIKKRGMPRQAGGNPSGYGQTNYRSRQRQPQHYYNNQASVNYAYPVDFMQCNSCGQHATDSQDNH